MVRLETDHETVAGVTLVRLFLETDARASVRIDLTHEGPVWPPRRQGVPAAGWSADGWTGVVDPERRLALGYATPTTLDDRPATVAEVEPLSDGEEDPSAPTARELVRTLGDPRPPREAVPASGGRTNAGADAGEAGSGADPSVSEPEPCGGPERASSTRSGTAPPSDGGRSTDETGPASTGHSLAAAAERIALAERLAAASTAAEAQAAVREAGGIEDVRALVERVSADRRRLATLADRSGHLAERAAAVDVPVEALERVT